MPLLSTLRNPARIRGRPKFYRALLLLVPLAASLTGCRRPLSEDELIRKANELARNGYAAKATELLEREKNPGFRSRLLHAEILLSDRKTDAGFAILRSLNPPADSLSRSRYLANLAYANFRKTPADPGLRAQIDEAVNLARPMGASETLALALLRKAYIYEFAPETEAWLQEALQIGRQLKDGYLQAWSLVDLGFRRYREREWDRALPYLREAEIHARNAGAIRMQNRALGNRGICYFSLGDRERAERAFNEALSLARMCNDDAMVLRWLNNLGLVNLYRGDLEPAERLYEQSGQIALKIGDRREYIRTVLNRAMTALDRGDARQADRILSGIASDRLDPEQDRRYRTHLARIKGEQGEVNEAVELFEDVIRDSEQNRDFGILWIARHRISELYRAEQMHPQARRSYLAALGTVEEHWASLPNEEFRFTLLDALRVLYTRTIDFFEQQGEHSEAMRIAESGRARLLAERVGRLSDLGRGALRRPPAGTVYLSYWLGKDRSSLWVTNASGVQAFELPAEKTIERLANQYSAAVREGSDVLEQEHPAGAELFRILIGPALPLIPKDARVVLSLDRSLHNISFATLPVYGPNPHYWIDDVSISVAPSLLLLENRPAVRRANDPVLLVGDPMPVEGFAELPQLSNEIERIAAKVEPGRLRVLSREKATAARYLAVATGDYALIHFAAHATANHDSPLDSAIILSPDGPESKLYAKDLLRRRIRTPLVCISACTSAGSRSYSGEGLVGFAWAFLQAGAESVVAGLWEADDAGTVELMDAFYAGIFEGLSVDKALQRAQQQLAHSKSRFRLPYYWGLFQAYTLRG